jgi:hypothetical protein
LNTRYDRKAGAKKPTSIEQASSELAMEAGKPVNEVLFDYRKIEPEIRAFVKELIREVAKRTVQGIVLIGQWLSEVKEQLPHGEWLPWLKSQFGWTDCTARRFMSVYDAFKSDNLSNLEIDVSALYLIAAPSTFGGGVSVSGIHFRQ